MLELLNFFIEDLKDNLMLLDKGLMALKNGRRGQEVLNDLFRVCHTIKGNSASMDFIRIEKVMHSMEDILQDIREMKLGLTEEVIDILYRCHDFLEDCLEVVARDHSEEKLSIDEILGCVESIKRVTGDKDESCLTYLPDDATPDNLNETIAYHFDLGYSAYEVKVCFSNDCVMKSIQAYLIFNKIAEAATILYSHPERPSEEAFRNPLYNIDSSSLHLVVFSPTGIAVLVENLGNVSGVELASQRELTDMEEVIYLVEDISFMYPVDLFVC